jgi:hypothetical protein
MIRGEKMPDTYAHYTFGQKVLSNLASEYKEIILENIDIFNVGLQGPDILFYYKPLVKNWINKIGYAMHKKSAAPFFLRAKKVIRNSKSKEESMSYIAGFICHFFLDSECHPFINALTERTDSLCHSEIETEFDRFLLKEDEKDPINYRVADHLTVNDYSAGIIAKFFREKRIVAKRIKKAVNDMKRYSVLLEELSQIKLIKDRNSKPRKKFLEFVRGMIMKPLPMEECTDSNVILVDLYTRAILPAAKLINKYFNSLESNQVNSRFETDYN